LAGTVDFVRRVALECRLPKRIDLDGWMWKIYSHKFMHLSIIVKYHGCQKDFSAYYSSSQTGRRFDVARSYQIRMSSA
jgi:hypothetical protein